jgi:hypothetical protein
LLRLKEANMSDFRDPRDPIYRDPLYGAMNDPAIRDARAEASSPGTAVAWFVGIALFIGVLIFAFGSPNDQQVAGTDTVPPPAANTQPAPAPAPKTPPAAVPPAQTPTTPAR